MMAYMDSCLGISHPSFAETRMDDEEVNYSDHKRLSKRNHP